MYGLCRLLEPTAGVPHIVLIHWVGEKVLESRQEACAGHLPAIRAFFKEAHLVLKASRVEEVTQEGLNCRLSLVAPPEAAFPKKDLSGDPEEVVGTNYRKTNPVLEILHTKRTSFWVQVEREEEERRQEERRRAQEERRCWERLRMEEERREAAERERRVQEKERLIQEQRKQQAQREAEEHQWEEARRREQARAMAGTGPRSWASETAQEVAGPSGHQLPRRDFFQTREQLSALRDPGPGVPRRPFLRYQRSLTETAYIFRRPPPLDLPGSFQAPIGPKPSTAPKPASPPTSTLPAHWEAEAVPLPCTPPCLLPPALACALNGTLAEPPHLGPSPESEHFLGQESPLLTPLGSCFPLMEETQAPSHTPKGQMSPSPAQGINGGAMDWMELPSPTANSPPRAGLGETAPRKTSAPPFPSQVLHQELLQARLGPS
ncbi:drebrin-like protein isoform X2 [Ahaetulla prasina]|uniref:drebrin-like protein isoform X2 n=1 Tax=Ahaetulla prasina TaxID=499056 RepID=UPI0026490E83|nr:drebrin-like protein isoform X2 [Ahaetulla prasina]